MGSGTNNYQEVKVLVDFDEIGLIKTEGHRYLWRLFTASGMAKGNQKEKKYRIYLVVFVDFDEISLRRRTEGSFLYCDSGGFLFTGGMTKFEVDIKYLK